MRVRVRVRVRANPIPNHNQASRFKYDAYVLNYGTERLKENLPALRAASPG